MKLLIILALLSQYVMADEWFCVEESGKRDGNTILACGIGDSLGDEGASRRRALDAAIQEFKTICELSSDCRGHEIIVEPKRTACGRDQKMPEIVKCYRLIQVTIGK